MSVGDVVVVVINNGDQLGFDGGGLALTILVGRFEVDIVRLVVYNVGHDVARRGFCYPECPAKSLIRPILFLFLGAERGKS